MPGSGTFILYSLEGINFGVSLLKYPYTCCCDIPYLAENVSNVVTLLDESIDFNIKPQLLSVSIPSTNPLENALIQCLLGPEL